jgi:hypothetical protein
MKSSERIINSDMAKKEQESVDWLIGRARSAAGYRNNIINNSDRSRSSTVIGKMYFFIYDPKHKDKLPIYDKFPLVFPIERYPDGFLGLNLHYLNTNERSALLNRLTEYRTNNKYNETTKLRLSYDLLASTKSLNSLMRPCIKRYLFTQVRSNFIEITANEWSNAINLPVQNFVTKS